MSESATLSAAIGTLYEAAIEPSKWPLALEHACGFVGGAQANLFWYGGERGEVGVLHQYNVDPTYTRLFQERFAALNPAYPAILFQEAGAVVVYSDLVPPEEERETVFYREWVAPQGFTGSIVAVLERAAARLAMLSFPWRDGTIDAAARQRFALLVPHVQRAVAIGRLFARHVAEAAALTQTLEGVDEAVFLLDGDGQVAFANARARALIEDGMLLRMPGGRLSAACAGADRALAAALRAIEDRAPADLQGTSLTLDDGPDGRWSAHLLPLAAGVRAHVGATHQACAALYVRHARAAVAMPLETLAQRHGLTASEMRVVQATLRTSGLDAIADALGISRATVKTHLNRVYRKCAVRNQSELIKLVAGLGPPA